jgi:hypothetical protein
MSDPTPAPDRGYAYPSGRLAKSAAPPGPAARAWARRRLAREPDGDHLADMLGLTEEGAE